MKKIAFVHGYSLCKMLRTLLCVSLCVCTGSFLTSCGTGLRETYLKTKNLSGELKVAIVASVSAPKVSYSSARGPVSGDVIMMISLLALSPLAGAVLYPVAAGAEAAIRSGVDNESAERVRDHVDLSHFEETVVQSFMQPIKKAGCFQTMDYITDKNQEAQRLSSGSYDAIIRLHVREISLKRVAGDNVRLHAYVRGEMKYISSGKVVWDREEHISPSELRPLDYYKENVVKELDAMLERAGRNLAYDFVYLR